MATCAWAYGHGHSMGMGIGHAHVHCVHMHSHIHAHLQCALCREPRPHARCRFPGRLLARSRRAAQMSACSTMSSRAKERPQMGHGTLFEPRAVEARRRSCAAVDDAIESAWAV